ncbi:hypothetical protein [Actinomyces urogenitalis]|uniref:hypothetical protein n=1 Tax=Actinomyces urogenitalis TaxID=103621 RepID=UPI00242EA031|nr:hypothetical protein [Actinomyces urogenitalis]MCI7457673.1 hypothetical protein [Actinomyces urogenitalis]
MTAETRSQPPFVPAAWYLALARLPERRPHERCDGCRSRAGDDDGEASYAYDYRVALLAAVDQPDATSAGSASSGY